MERLIIAGLVVTVLVIGSGLYLLFTVSVAALRLWAALATVAAIIFPIAAYWLGLKEAHARIKGIEQGIEKVAKAATEAVSAANQVAQLKADMARRVKEPPVQQIILPGVPFSGGLIAPVRREGEEVELE
jgi:hypothetical protein